MDQGSLHLVDLEDPSEPTELPPAPPGTVHCQECTILIGPGYLEQEPFSHPGGSGVVCGACLESLERRARRRPAPAMESQPVETWVSRHGERH
jgi:hypothetical protein